MNEKSGINNVNEAIQPETQNYQIILPGKNCQFIVTKTKLGEGTFSKVYKGFIQRQDLVAVKKINMEKIEKHRANLEDEIRIMKSLKHENIVNLLDVVTQKDGQIYLIIEHCADGDLKHYLKKRPMREKHAKHYLKQLMEGLKYLKTQNVMHRDLKPQNLLLTNDKQTLKISDFGFAKVLSSDESMAETMCGTPYYMAPEIMHNKKYLSKADLWSVGIITYEIFYGTYPYGDNVVGPYEWRDKIDTVEIKYPSFPLETDNELSESAVSLLKELLQKDPEKRISWERYFIHYWFFPHLKSTKSTSSILIPTNSGGGGSLNHTTNAVSAPVSSHTKQQGDFGQPTRSNFYGGGIFDMEDSTSNLPQQRLNNGVQRRNPTTFNSSSPFFESGVSISASPQDNQSVNTSFLNLVENYRSVNNNGTTGTGGDIQKKAGFAGFGTSANSIPRKVKDNRPPAPAFSPPVSSKSNVGNSSVSNVRSNSKPLLQEKPQEVLFSFEKEEPSIIKKHNIEDEEEEVTKDSKNTNNQGSAIAENIKEYFNTSLRLAKDSFRSFQALN